MYYKMVAYKSLIWLTQMFSLMLFSAEWLKPNGERIPMYDEDPAFSRVEQDNCKKMATLACYRIPDNSMVALLTKQQFNDTKSSLPRHGECPCDQTSCYRYLT